MPDRYSHPDTSRRARHSKAPATDEVATDVDLPTRRAKGVSFWRAMSPRGTRAQLLAALLCAVVGFAVAVQVNQTQTDGLDNLRQADLVRLLDEVSQRGEALDAERRELESQVSRLQESSSADQAAREAAREAQLLQDVLTGATAVKGPGVIVRSRGPVDAGTLVNMLQELRNAGAEAISINDHRVVVSTSFTQRDRQLLVDNEVLDQPLVWRAIGDPATLQPALEIPGGALASLRGDGAEVSIESFDEIEILATATLATPDFAVEAPDQ
ncbi:DUF881 domain-containing protein [Rarobacter faecitabidus]|uniref:Uncharacterized protein YlxW (UPF0749 family) n=1 Tax=Rarobacter faecitabidus TaxID=13243 RepID=A0A542ZW18_RARFA|nr:DUF881 domain-containing protein [Rarobacter faecitabidus]TQL64390.1 uncharacterized protein YlxW (UPF0749 family) [Rarobacter faecitabidus]